MTTVDDGTGSVIGEDAPWLDARPVDAADARAAVASYLRRRRAPPARAILDDVLLVVSELVTNALRHAGGVTGLRVAVRDPCIEVTVQDPSPRAPVAAEHRDDWLPGGYGWRMVSRIAEVAVVPLGRAGKLVRATVPAPLGS